MHSNTCTECGRSSHGVATLARSRPGTSVVEGRTNKDMAAVRGDGLSKGADYGIVVGPTISFCIMLPQKLLQTIEHGLPVNLKAIAKTIVSVVQTAKPAHRLLYEAL